MSKIRKCSSGWEYIRKHIPIDTMINVSQRHKDDNQILKKKDNNFIVNIIRNHGCDKLEIPGAKEESKVGYIVKKRL